MDTEFNIESSLVAILFVVINVFPVHFALHADIRVQGDVDELDGHQGLQVLRVQEFPVVGVILKGEAFSNTVVLHLAELTCILFSLQAREYMLSVSNIFYYFTEALSVLRAVGKGSLTLFVQWIGITWDWTLCCASSGMLSFVFGA